MLFYSIAAELPEDSREPEKSERTNRVADIQSKAEAFFAKQNDGYHIAVTDIRYKAKKVSLCAAVKKPALSMQMLQEFFSAIELETEEKLTIEETTLDAYACALHRSCRNDFIEDDDDVFDMMGIKALRHSHQRQSLGTRFSETILSDRITKSEMLRKVQALLCDDGLRLEMERICQGAEIEGIFGHPVHYLLLTDNLESKKEVSRLLLSALYQNGRIINRRSTEVVFDADDSFDENAFEELYSISTGGTVIASFLEMEIADSEYAQRSMDVLDGLCATLRKYRNRVLTIFCIPRKAEGIKNALLEHLGAVTVVPISQETVFGNRAKAYLRARAREHGITGGRSLYKAVIEGCGYNAADLNLIFDEWYDRQIKTKVYRQYAAFETANRQAVARKPRGSAVDELEKMIGLADAKDVIHQALDFYKAQRLFKEKGFAAERPAMHMVFSGNPGTAKTSVARLFARIMKDNGLLSVGNLHEVGRADLVDRYLGGTAPRVKAKFKAAKGSVLFIDEAYALVDDKDGLYGDEAINTIVQEMENHRDDMVVIFAGYPDKMEGFLQKNPGLRSRIAFHVPFADYSAEELYRITELLAQKRKVSLDGAVQERLLPIFEAAMGSKDFGNGRFARNLFEKALMRQASRLVQGDVDGVTKEMVGTLTADDFAGMAAEKKAEVVRRIGFGE